MSLLACAGAARAATPFQRGDVFVLGTAGVKEYSPSGALRQTMAGTANATAICVDPSGRHLILPGAGLFDRSGQSVASRWASVTNRARCVADGFGHVYVSTQTAPYSITKYDLTGHALRTFTITTPEFHALAIDLAPDECTIYYGSWFPSAGSGIRRLNGCTGVQGSTYNGDNFVDDLRVRPDRSVLVTDDTSARLSDASGQFVRSYGPPNCSGGSCSDSLRTMALDPNEKSFRVCCMAFKTPAGFGDPQILQFGIGGGQLLSHWAPSGGADVGAAMAVYSPPLVGGANVEGPRDTNPAGTAEAFTATAGSTGQITRLHLYVDPSSSATKAVVGVYSDRNGHPSTLLRQATISGLMRGSWNYADVSSTSVAAGQRYWIAVLGPKGAGSLQFRDIYCGGGRSETSRQTTLTTLPATWTSGAAFGSAPLSAFGS